MTTTSLPIPPCSRSGAPSVTRPAESSSASKAPPLKKRLRRRRSELRGCMSWMKLSLKRSKPSGVKTATHGSSHFARTRPSENEARNFAGTVSRFFASSEYSKWPLNATCSSHGKALCELARVAEWEEPRDSGLFACRSSSPHSPTLQLFSPPVRSICIDGGGSTRRKPHSHAVLRRGRRWEAGPQVVLQREGPAGIDE